MKPDSEVVVSVVIPTYNSASTIIRAIESALNQTYQKIEIIVVDDGSTDSTKEVLYAYIQENKIIYLYQKNAGCGAARNYGVSIARGKYIALLDADDYWHKEKLEQQMKIFQDDPEVVVCSTESYLVDPFSELVWETKRDVAHRLRSGSVVCYFAFHNIITLSSAVVLKEKILEVDGFETKRNLMMVADLDMWLKLAPKGKFYAITTPLTFYQIRHDITQEQIQENHRQIAEVFRQRMVTAPGAARFWYTLGWVRELLLYRLSVMKIFSTYKKIGLGGIVRELLRRAYVRLDFLVYPFLIYKLNHASFQTIKELCDFSYRGSLRLLVPGQVESEITEFLEIIQKIQPKNILEVGTAHGGNLFLLTKIAKDGGKIISIDLPNGDYGGGYFARKKTVYKRFAQKNQQMFFVRGDSHATSSYHQVENYLKGEKLDVLFIDADHSYEGVKSDFEMYQKLVRPGGIIGFHDIANDPDETYGVHRFWNEIKNTYRHQELIDDAERTGYGIGIIFL